MRPHKFDCWLTGICLARTCNGLVFVTYAAALPVLQPAWRMSAASAGAVAGAFQFSYAVSLIVFSSLADRFNPKMLYLSSMTASAVFAMLFAALGGGGLIALGTALLFRRTGHRSAAAVEENFPPVRRHVSS